MKKYMEVAKITFKTQINYRFDTIISVSLSFVRILLAFMLWSVLFRDKVEIGGFTFSMMISYYIIMSFFRRLDTTDSIVWQLSSEIRDGQFTKYIVRPVKPLLYFTAICYSKMVFIFGINLIATIIYAVVFNKYFVLQGNVYVYISAILISILGLNFLILLNYFIAILSFKFLEIGAFNMIKNNILEFLTGTLIPLALVPLWLQNTMKFFPFYYVYYLPSMLFMNKEVDQIYSALIVLIMWNAIMLLLISLTYNLLKRNYEGVGV